MHRKSDRSDSHRIRDSIRGIFGSSSSHHSSSRHEDSHNSSLNTVTSELVHSGDVVTGARPSGRMSVVRRFFCLFVTFDLLFTILMWLICIMLMGQDVFKMMSQQIVHYNIHTSLFDIVMAAAARFVVLLLFYGLLYINHWGVIALSTAGTCSFLIAKVFLYNWQAANSPVLQVLLIITSFVISWGEAWFLDFRVIPQEVLAHDLMRGQSGFANERSPLLQPYLQGLTARYDDQPESVRNFYSPMDSPAGSDDEEHTNRAHQPANLISVAQEAMATARHTLAAPNWRREKLEDNGDTVDSRPRSSGGKIYRLEGLVKAPSQRILHLLYNELDTSPVWNRQITLARRLEVINDQTDISYQIVAEAAGGMISPRDLVTLRHWERQGSTYALVAVSTTHSAAPPKSKPIRGIQGPSIWIMEPGPSSGVTKMHWLCDTDLRGWIPQTLLDQAFASSMLEWMTFLRRHLGVLETHS